MFASVSPRAAGRAARVLALVLMALVLAPEPGLRPAPARVEARPDAELNARWNAYGDAGDGWTGGDCGASVPLPDGRVAWLFCDTFLGTVGPDRTRPQNAPIVRNAIVVQDGATLRTLHGGTRQHPESLVGPTRNGPGAVLYWPGDGLVAGAGTDGQQGRLRVFYSRMTQTGTGPLDFRAEGTGVVELTLPGLEVAGYQILPLSSRVSWGAAVLEQPDHTYVYGVEDVGGTKFLHIARTPPGDLLGHWEFFTGTGWSSLESGSARVMSGVGDGFSVDQVGGRYMLVTVDSHLTFSPQVVAYLADSPTGPFGDPLYLYSAPEAAFGSQHVVYGARLHPELGRGDTLVISYNVNSLRPEDLYADAAIYRPRFIDVRLPAAAADPAVLPSRPSRLTAWPGNGTVRLSWTASARGASYWVYLRDVTAGHTGFSRLPLPVVGATSAGAGRLVAGHMYQFRVTAVTAAGESLPSDVVSAVAPA